MNQEAYIPQMDQYILNDVKCKIVNIHLLASLEGGYWQPPACIVRKSARQSNSKQRSRTIYEEHLLAYLTFVWSSSTKPNINACAMCFSKISPTSTSKIYKRFFCFLLTNSTEVKKIINPPGKKHLVPR
jgi:hypothetical protein